MVVFLGVATAALSGALVFHRPLAIPLAPLVLGLLLAALLRWTSQRTAVGPPEHPGSAEIPLRDITRCEAVKWALSISYRTADGEEHDLAFSERVSMPERDEWIARINSLRAGAASAADDVEVPDGATELEPEPGDELSELEVTEIDPKNLEIVQGTIASRISRCLAKLRELLSGPVPSTPSAA